MESRISYSPRPPRAFTVSGSMASNRSTSRQHKFTEISWTCSSRTIWLNTSAPVNTLDRATAVSLEECNSRVAL